jgi:hypothetical protein
LASELNAEAIPQPGEAASAMDFLNRSRCIFDVHHDQRRPCTRA